MDFKNMPQFRRSLVPSLQPQKKYCNWFRISQSTWVKFCGISNKLNMLQKNMWCKHHFQHHDAYQITWEVFFSPGKTGQFIAILQLRTWNLNLHRLWTSLWAGPKSYSVWIYPPQLTIVYTCEISKTKNGKTPSGDDCILGCNLWYRVAPSK